MIPLVKVSMPPREILLPALEEVLYSGMVAEGEYVYRFEKAFGEYFGLPNLLSQSSGTAALHTALTLAGVGPGSEVVSTPMTAEPTNMAILYSGAKVVWADVNSENGTLDPDSVRDAITPKTKAIMIVHYAGYPTDMESIMKIAAEKSIPVIEDCAHSLGAMYDGKPIGTMGDYSIFSFQAIKHFTTVDGGAISIKDDKRIDEAKRFRWFGMLKGVSRTEVDIESIGYKYNMSNVTAAIGLTQLKVVDSVLSRHIANGRYYDEKFSSISGFAPARFDIKASPSYWVYTLLCDDAAGAERILKEHEVIASKLHKPNNRHSIFSGSARKLPGLDRFYSRLLHIPCGWWVTDDDRAMIVDALARG
ncbi:MAG: pyridoxal-5'-phosphate-dependent protein [Spirochaetes bacterium GWB1_48_6]|nr:MAG: pyridoxal-5'-phosphate-dependent protein [Spirochaetes bacterium GWB1_48_6]